MPEGWAGRTEAWAPSARTERRKLRTRQALVEAAVRLIAEGRGNRASIEEITRTADVGFGSFYNHFESKDELFRTASHEMLERLGAAIDTACDGLEDAAVRFATSLRIVGRLAWGDPDLAHFLTGAGLQSLEDDAPGGLAPRALRDLVAARTAGRFTTMPAEAALGAAVGGLLGLLRAYRARPGSVSAADVDAFAAATLRLLGLAPAEAESIATAPLPDIPAW